MGSNEIETISIRIVLIGVNAVGGRAEGGETM